MYSKYVKRAIFKELYFTDTFIYIKIGKLKLYIRNESFVKIEYSFRT